MNFMTFDSLNNDFVQISSNQNERKIEGMCLRISFSQSKEKSLSSIKLVSLRKARNMVKEEKMSKIDIVEPFKKQLDFETVQKQEETNKCPSIVTVEA